MLQPTPASDLDRNVVETAYARWAPVYDKVCGPIFLSGRRSATSAAMQVGGRILEVGVIDKAMQTMPPRTIEQLHAVTEQMRAQAEQGHPFADEDREFHRLLFHHLGNKALLMLLDAFWLVFRKAAQHTNIQDPNPMSTYRDHAAILAAIEAGDSEAARQALAQHYDGLLGRLRNAQEEKEREPR